jgi:hypothetical protein
MTVDFLPPLRLGLLDVDTIYESSFKWWCTLLELLDEWILLLLFLTLLWTLLTLLTLLILLLLAFVFRSLSLFNVLRT